MHGLHLQAVSSFPSSFGLDVDTTGTATHRIPCGMTALHNKFYENRSHNHDNLCIQRYDWTEEDQLDAYNLRFHVSVVTSIKLIPSNKNRYQIPTYRSPA